MQRLVEAGLCGDGLIEVKTASLVERYNDALKSLGIAPTARTSFSIDGIGWSPEIAEEKGDYFYLLSGGASQFGIILSPDQEQKPVYVPYTSYLRRLLKGYFEKYRKEIVDVTTTHGITLDIDPEVSRFTNPKNLLLVDYVVVHSGAGNLIAAAEDQKRMAADLVRDDDRWFDADLRRRLAHSGKTYGDLRYRTLAIGDYPFNDMSSFFTESFGGTYVLRKKDSKLLVLAGEKAVEEYESPEKGVVSLVSPDLPDILIGGGWVSVDLGWYGRNTKKLQEIEECLRANLILEAEPHVSYISLTEAHKKNIVGKVRNEQSALLEEVQWLLKHFDIVRMGRKSEFRGAISSELKTILMRPRGDSVALQETVALLLSNLRSHDPLELYQADKNRFMSAYRSWSSAKKEWAIERIMKHYRPTMNQ